MPSNSLIVESQSARPGGGAISGGTVVKSIQPGLTFLPKPTFIAPDTNLDRCWLSSYGEGISGGDADILASQESALSAD